MTKQSQYKQDCRISLTQVVNHNTKYCLCYSLAELAKYKIYKSSHLNTSYKLNLMIISTIKSTFLTWYLYQDYVNIGC